MAYSCEPAPTTAPLSPSLAVTFATYWQFSTSLISPKSTVAEPLSSASATSYKANFSSWLVAYTSVSLRKPAWWTEPWLNVWMTTSSSSVMVVSQMLTRPSVDPESKTFGEVGWKLSCERH